jgi:hypothetical protein
MELLMREIDDYYVRENFRRLRDLLVANLVLEGFTHIDQNIEQAVANFKISHGLGLVPLDVIQTHLTGTGTVTWNYDLFDRNYLDLTTTGPIRIRAFVGTFKRSRGG